jgi:predicted phage-related endonuclease
MTERVTHNLVQGSPEWLEFRLHHFGASEAAAMLGLSKTVKRTELLHMKHTGTAKEFSDWVQANILDYGHEVEALARPIIEMSLGEDLYPMVFSRGKMSASCDGLTMLEDIAWENKQRNKALYESIANGVLPEEHMPQAQQVLMVSGARLLKFSCSDGTEEGTVTMDVLPNPAWQQRLIDGWAQFEKDLAEYVPAVTEAKPVGRTPETMPALRIEVTGMVTASNLQAYRDHALAIFSGINRELTTDQHFADAEKTVKWCEEVESKLKAAKEHALSQTESIDALFKTIDDITAEARTVRLELDKLVTKRKAEVKDAIIVKARTAYDQHEKELIKETGGPWIVLRQPDFAGAAKGKRTVASIQDAVDTVLANAKIEADASAKRIRANLTCIKEDGAEYEFLFADKLALIGKPLEDLQLIVKTRIAEHKAAEEKRKADALAREEAEKAKAATVVTPAPVATAAQPAPVTEPAKQVTAPWVAPAVSTPKGAPTLRLGQINERLAPIALTAEGLATLGFKHSATDKAAKLYFESEFEPICAALVRHLEAALQKQAA